ncbi:MAG: Response regulator containing CheY-like receiver,AAA-type ATPase, and DNA-binding domain, partial [Chthonomonadales bacterium]|nr:Response regulator containing CheY-like receiver,AAA-type ATPase, and DNA-binding domain [Chthonomonadales bacterium]
MSQPTKTNTILIADDEPNIRRVLEAMLTKEGYTVFTAENGKRALDVAAANAIDVLVSDLIMPDMNGVELLQRVKEIHPNCTAIIVTAYGTIKSAVEAMRYGAFTYLSKPFDIDEVRVVLKQAIAHRDKASEEATIKRSAPGKTAAAPGILDCVSASMREVYRLVDRVAETRATVLIRGESGTGKELIA